MWSGANGYPLTVAEIRARRHARELNTAKSRMHGFSDERRQVVEEYRRVSEVYIRHLERLNKKMKKVLDGQRSVASVVNKLHVEKFGESDATEGVT